MSEQIRRTPPSAAFGPWQGTAVFSADRRHRYRLDRPMGAGPAVLWVMLNPSTADEARNDPTVRRVLGFSRLWGCGKVIVCNLHSLRGTDPACLDELDDYTSHLGDDYVRAARCEAARVVIGWGAHGARWPRRVRHLCDLLGDDDLWCLGTTTHTHQPRHPLYVRGDTQLTRWSPPKETL